ncbi:hypothetical protein EZS27_025508 [termite gut metagenome]|uniref:Uncharacterized protein n=1 Tax=termite gut metagenome TaxID=433724 RepID=A0A5J4QVX3_9ZZZZ
MIPNEKMVPLISSTYLLCLMLFSVYLACLILNKIIKDYEGLVFARGKSGKKKNLQRKAKIQKAKTVIIDCYK